jgi:hypothetical protein
MGWFGQGHNSQGTLCPRGATSKNFRSGTHWSGMDQHCTLNHRCQDDVSPNNLFVLKTKSHGRSVPWTMCPLADADDPGLHRGTCLDKLFWVMLGGLQPSNLTQQKVSLSRSNRTHQSGMHYLRNASSKGHIVQGTQYPGVTDSQGYIVQGYNILSSIHPPNNRTIPTPPEPYIHPSIPILVLPPLPAAIDPSFSGTNLPSLEPSSQQFKKKY